MEKKVSIEFNLAEILCDSVFDVDEDGWGTRGWEELDTEDITTFEVSVEEEFENDDYVVIDEVLNYLTKQKYLTSCGNRYRIDVADIIQCNVYDMKRDDKPLYRVSLM